HSAPCGAFPSRTIVHEVECGISQTFIWLSPTARQVTHVLLTRAPLYYRTEVRILVRLACVRHAASVRSEPGSNSPVKPENLMSPPTTTARWPPAKRNLSKSILRPPRRRGSHPSFAMRHGTHSASCYPVFRERAA